MADLPAVKNIKPADRTKILEAFGGEEAFLEWQIQGIRDFVTNQELAALDRGLTEARASVLSNVNAYLPKATQTEPVVPVPPTQAQIDAGRQVVQSGRARAEERRAERRAARQTEREAAPAEAPVNP